MEILGERPVWSMSGSEMLSTLDDTYAEIARLETSALHLIQGLESTGHAQELGAGTTARLLTFRYRIDATKARRDVHLATTLPKYPSVAAALPAPNPHHATADPADETSAADNTAEDNGADGNDASLDGAGVDGAGMGVLLHPAQAEAIVSALEKAPTTVPVDDLHVAEQEMVKLGRTHGPLELRKAGVQIRNRLDTDGPEPDEQKAYDRESLTLKNTANGVDFRGYLANENAELFRILIHTHAKPHKTIDGALDPRARTKRQADALTTLLTTANNPTATTATAAAFDHAATTLLPTTDPTATLDQASTSLPAVPTNEEPAATSTSAGTPGHTPAEDASRIAAASTGHKNNQGFIPGHGPKAHITVTIDFNDLKAATADKIGHLIYGDGLSAATIRRLACDAQILPMVLGSDSQPLDVGTTIRLATGPMRKALITRDQGCVCCGAPPIYCDAHHVKSWIDGGETKITNLVLLCKRCHRDLHAGHWNIHITNGIVHVTRPTWATPNPIPHNKYRPPTTTPHPTEPTSGTTTPGTATPGSPRLGITTADATTPGVADALTSGGSARAWPRETDPPWITPEDTARLNPWGDAGDDRPTRRQKVPPSGDFDPWGEHSEGGPAVAPKQFANASTEPADASAGPADARTDPWSDATLLEGQPVNGLADARTQRRSAHELFAPDTGLAS